MTKEYVVTVPIAGHAYVTVLAEDEESAIEMALDEASLSDIDEWTALHAFIEGNVVYCPSPWEITIESVTDLEDGK